MIFISTFFKKILTFVVIILFLVSFSSSYNALSIEKLAYVVAIGIDVSDKNQYSFSFQFTNITSNTESGTSEKSPSIVNSVDASSIGSAINLMNTYIGKKLNLSHCKVIVFSEQVANEGISNHIYTLMNDSQIRPSANIVVSKCNAKYYIENSKPILENLITKYYDIFPSSSDYTAYTVNATIGDFLNTLECKTCNPVAILGGMNTEDLKSLTDLTQIEDSSNKSNESTISGKRGAENIGLAVFKNDKLVGELDALNCLSYLNMSNKVNSFFVSIPDPLNQNSYIDLYLSHTHLNDISIDTSNSSPYIKVKLSYTAKIYSMGDNSKYLDDKVLEEISKSCNSYLESTFSNYLYKTSKEFKSDINEFGKYALSKFLTTQDFQNYNWNENYKNAFFDVEVDTCVKSSMSLTET
ncbi:MAG: hypothetical protein J6I85_03025 [Clostridia bacterium]|nr:hypothetical protein [Clostridia bacterium]